MTPVVVQRVSIAVLVHCSRAVLVVKDVFDNTGRFARQMITGIRQESQQQYVELMAKSTMPSQN